MGIGWRQNIGVDEVLHVPGAGAAMAAGKGAASCTPVEKPPALESQSATRRRT